MTLYGYAAVMMAMALNGGHSFVSSFAMNHPFSQPTNHWHTQTFPLQPYPASSHAYTPAHPVTSSSRVVCSMGLRDFIRKRITGDDPSYTQDAKQEQSLVEEDEYEWEYEEEDDADDDRTEETSTAATSNTDPVARTDEDAMSVVLEGLAAAPAAAISAYTRESSNERISRYKSGKLTEDEKAEFLNKALGVKNISRPTSQNQNTQTNDDAGSKTNTKRRSTPIDTLSDIINQSKTAAVGKLPSAQAPPNKPAKFDDAAKEAYYKMVTSPDRFPGYSTKMKQLKQQQVDNDEDETNDDTNDTFSKDGEDANNNQTSTQNLDPDAQIERLSQAKNNLLQQQTLFQDLVSNTQQAKQLSRVGMQLSKNTPYLPKDAGILPGDKEAAAAAQKRADDLATRLEEFARKQEEKDGALRVLHEEKEEEARQLRLAEREKMVMRQREQEEKARQRELEQTRKKVERERMELERQEQAKREKMEQLAKLQEAQDEYWKKKLEEEQVFREEKKREAEAKQPEENAGDTPALPMKAETTGLPEKEKENMSMDPRVLAKLKQQQESSPTSVSTKSSDTKETLASKASSFEQPIRKRAVPLKQPVDEGARRRIQELNTPLPKNPPKKVSSPPLPNISSPLPSPSPTQSTMSRGSSSPSKSSGPSKRLSSQTANDDSVESISSPTTSVSVPSRYVPIAPIPSITEVQQIKMAALKKNKDGEGGSSDAAMISLDSLTPTEAVFLEKPTATNESTVVAAASQSSASLFSLKALKNVLTGVGGGGKSDSSKVKRSKPSSAAKAPSRRLQIPVIPENVVITTPSDDDSLLKEKPSLQRPKQQPTPPTNEKIASSTAPSTPSVSSRKSNPSSSRQQEPVRNTRPKLRQELPAGYGDPIEKKGIRQQIPSDILNSSGGTSGASEESKRKAALAWGVDLAAIERAETSPRPVIRQTIPSTTNADKPIRSEMSLDFSTIGDRTSKEKAASAATKPIVRQEIPPEYSEPIKKKVIRQQIPMDILSSSGGGGGSGGGGDGASDDSKRKAALAWGVDLAAIERAETKRNEKVNLNTKDDSDDEEDDDPMIDYGSSSASISDYLK